MLYSVTDAASYLSAKHRLKKPITHQQLRWCYTVWGELPEPFRVGRHRVLRQKDVLQCEAVLIKRGYIPTPISSL